MKNVPRETQDDDSSSDGGGGGDDSDDEEKKTSRKKRKLDPIVSSYTVDNADMMELKNFYDADVEIQTCRERKRIETFRHECTVAWWFMQDVVQLHNAPYFHIDAYMRRLHDMLAIAQDYLSLFRCVAFYYARDMIAWVLAEDGSLPFGVVELGVNRSDTRGAFYWVRREGHFERELIYECSDEAISERFDFYVFNMGATFEPSERTYGGSACSVTPISPFRELIRDRAELNEARVCLGDANFMATHPEGFIYSKPLPNTDIENIPEETRYIEDDLATASLATSLHRANLTSTLTGGYINKFRNMSRPLTSPSQDKLLVQQMYYERSGCPQAGGPDAAPPTLYQERQAEFARPSIKATLEELPSYTEVSRGPPPASLISPAELARRYDDKVCQLMNFPHLFFKPHRGGGEAGPANRSGTSTGGAGTASGSMVFAQRQLDDAVCQQQTVYQQIFQELYERTFSVMDRLLFAHLPPEYGPITERITARMLFDNQITKSDEAIHGLLPFYKEGIVTKDDIRKLLVRNYALLEVDEQQKRDDAEATGASPMKTTPAPENKKKRKADDIDDSM